MSLSTIHMDQKIEELKGMIRYSKEVLCAGGLAEWEAKEYSAVLDDDYVKLHNAMKHREIILEMMAQTMET